MPDVQERWTPRGEFPRGGDGWDEGVGEDCTMVGGCGSVFLLTHLHVDAEEERALVPVLCFHPLHASGQRKTCAERGGFQQLPD